MKLSFHLFHHPRSFPLSVTSFLMLALLTALSARSQPNNAVHASTESWFDSVIGIENSGIINGPQYKMDRLGASSHPFFGSGETKGRISFDHQWYDAVFLYDIYTDKIVVKHIGGSGRGWFIELEKTRVQGFIIDSRSFMNFDRGFHEVIFDSPALQVLSKRNKSSQIRNGIFNYVVNNEYFIVASGQWKRLRSKGSFIKAVDKENRRDVKRYLQQNNIRVRKFEAAELASVARFVATLRQRKQS